MKHSSNSKKAVAFAVAIALVAVTGISVSHTDTDALQVPSNSLMNTASSNSVRGSNPLILAKTGEVQLASFHTPVLQAATEKTAAAQRMLSGSELAMVTMTPNEKTQFEMPADFVPSNAQGLTEGAPFSRINLKEISTGNKAIVALGENLLAVANWYGYSEQDLKDKLMNEEGLHVDRKGRLLHIDPGLPVQAGSSMNGSTASGTTSIASAPYPSSTTFKLHSKANSNRILYLNFTGEGSKPAFSLDTIPNTFNDAEHAMIQKIWQRVTEDYAAFDVDVTTEKPTNFTGKIGVTILITPQNHTAGGYAYLNSFKTYTGAAAPAFCFPNKLANSEKPIAECISHELGHTLGLMHQGANPSTAYYAGHGSGEVAWAPIMGVSYYKNLTQWSKGEYANANNKEDAYAIMSARGLKPNIDDVGNTISAAMGLTAASANGFNNLSGSGLISVPGDVDVYKFNAGAGNASFTFTGAANSQNLDIAAQIMDASGKVLAVTTNQTTLNKTLNVNFPVAGTYYVSVTGAGRGSPTVTGYTNYGSLGKYTIVGKTLLTTSTSTSTTSPATTTTPTSTTNPSTTTNPPTTTTSFKPVTVTFDARGTTISGASIKSYSWNFGDGTALGTTALVTHTYTKAGTYNVVLTISDSLNRTYKATSSVVIK